jgi:hypothetical protein
MNGISEVAVGCLITEDGESIDWVEARQLVEKKKYPIFAAYPTACSISKVKDVRLSNGVAMLRTIAGFVPPQQSDINPKANTHHTLIIVQAGGNWRYKKKR